MALERLGVGGSIGKAILYVKEILMRLAENEQSEV
jgi:hypothetical protein